MRKLRVHLLPKLVDPRDLSGGVSVVVDILRATTSIVHALAAGAAEIIPVEDIAEARKLAGTMPPGQAILAGERGGLRIDGFDIGNSPSEFTAARCEARTIVFTTTNGTRAILHAKQANRILIGAFVNFSAICFDLVESDEDIDVVCAGTDGELSLEDTVFAGAVTATLADRGEFELNDGARIAWDAFEGHGSVLPSMLELSQGGRNLASVGLSADLRCAARIDCFGIVPHASSDPPRITIGALHCGARLPRHR